MNHLTEPGVRNHFIESFKICKENRMNYNTKVVNGALLIMFIGGITVFLYLKKKNKLSPVQKNKKKEEDRLYIINKIKTLQVDKNLITNLPHTFA